jgi:hypothetical protein
MTIRLTTIGLIVTIGPTRIDHMTIGLMTLTLMAVGVIAFGHMTICFRTNDFMTIEQHTH